jgi:hypothetical protein
MGTFQVPRNLKLRDLPAELERIGIGPFEVNNYAPTPPDAEAWPPWGTELPCSRCPKPISNDDPICWDWHRDPVPTFINDRGFQEYEPEPVSHVTVWHFTCEPELPQGPDPAVLADMAQRIADPRVPPVLKVPALAEALTALDSRIEPCPTCGAKLYWSAPSPPALIWVWCEACGYEVRNDARF